MSSLDNLRKAAKRWLKALREHDAAAHARLRRVHPTAPANPGLRDVQHALALERGAASWIALTAQIAAADAATALESPGTALSALLAAAGAGDVPRVAAILDAHPAIINERGVLQGHIGLRTALHFGVGHEAIVGLLLERGADANVRDDGDNAMPLHFAAENQNLAIIRLLIEHGADPIGDGDGHELGILGWSCCWDYVETKSEIVDYLLAHGARHTIFTAVTLAAVDEIARLVAQTPSEIGRRMDRTNLRRTPLHLAVVKRQRRSLETLIGLGADLEALDAAGLTPLDQAALGDDGELAALLIDRGAVVHLPAAVALRRTAEIERLIHAQPEVLTPGQRYGALLVRAAGRSPAHVIDTLLRLGADVNVRDDTGTSVDSAGGYTPLHAAAFHGNEEAVITLVKHGADINARDDRYCATPAGWAAYAGHRAIRDRLLRGPIDIFQAIDFDVTERIPQLLKTDRGAIDRPFRDYARCTPRPDQRWPEQWCTPLAWAAIKNNVEAVKYLVNDGAALTVAPDGRTVVDIARAKGHTHVVEVLTPKAERPSAGAPGADAERVATFMQFASWDNDVHGKSDHRMYDRAAQRMLAQHPEIARASLHTAVVCGDLVEVERVLAERPEAARERGGPKGYTPLLYLAFARFSHPPAIDNAAAIAGALLDRDANPNDYFMAGHSRYCALVGVAREGEQDAPPHPRREELFQLLIERGANIYDQQVVYNTHFSTDMLWWLKLVYARAEQLGQLTDWKDPDWPMFDMGGYGTGSVFLLSVAIDKNNVELTRWLLGHGAGANGTRPVRRNETGPAHTLYAYALLQGRSEIADLLVQHGATPTPPRLDGEDALVDACLRLDRTAIDAQLATHPEYLRSPRAMFEAARRNRADVVRLLLDLGVPVDVHDALNKQALHEAAWHNAVDAAQVLIERGADVDAKESQYGAPPIGWAAHGDRQEMIELLSHHSRHVWDLAFRGYVDRLRQVLREDPSLATAVGEHGTTLLWWLPDDEETALAVVELLLAHGADPSHRIKDGTTAADWASKRGMLDVAQRLRQ